LGYELGRERRLSEYTAARIDQEIHRLLEAQREVVTNLITRKRERESDRPVIFVLFGAAGDLSHRLILPALYALHRDGQLPACFALIGADRVSLSNQEACGGIPKVPDNGAARIA
jgi:Glucose-6-phosphate dehydrogenase, NAD binding domain